MQFLNASSTDRITNHGPLLVKIQHEGLSQLLNIHERHGPWRCIKNFTALRAFLINSNRCCYFATRARGIPVGLLILPRY
jgi:hypothetical protein